MADASLEFTLRNSLARRFVRLGRRCANVAVWPAPWLAGDAH